jgi:hypothetical protein
MKIFKISQKVTEKLFDLYDVVWNANSIEELKNELVKNNINFNELNLKGNIVLTINHNGKKQVIDDSLNIKEATEWIWSILDHQLDQYIGEDNEDFNEKFWKNVCTPYGNNELYHATRSKNVDEIKARGLLKMNKSRGINNKSTGNAVFTSLTDTDIDSYGEIIIKIDMCQMKKDGYMPEVSMEKPIEEANLRNQLAWKIGIKEFNAIDEYSSEGLFETTVVIYGNIPPKYLYFA